MNYVSVWRIILWICADGSFHFSFVFLPVRGCRCAAMSRVSKHEHIILSPVTVFFHQRASVSLYTVGHEKVPTDFCR